MFLVFRFTLEWVVMKYSVMNIKENAEGNA